LTQKSDISFPSCTLVKCNPRRTWKPQAPVSVCMINTWTEEITFSWALYSLYN
jgi:hypothetical protein